MSEYDNVHFLVHETTDGGNKLRGTYYSHGQPITDATMSVLDPGESPRGKNIWGHCETGRLMGQNVLHRSHDEESRGSSTKSYPSAAFRCGYDEAFGVKVEEADVAELDRETLLRVAMGIGGSRDHSEDETN